MIEAVIVALVISCVGFIVMGLRVRAEAEALRLENEILRRDLEAFHRLFDGRVDRRSETR